MFRGNAMTQWTNRHRQKGLSLVELMISLTLGLVLMTGVVQMFLASRVTYSTQQGVSRIQEGGRMAVEFLSQDIRMAGFMGCSSRNPNIQNGLNASPTDFLFDFNQGIQGFTDANIPAGANLDDGVNGGVTPVPGSDVLVVRRASTNALPIIGTAGTSANFTIASAAGNNCLVNNALCDQDIAIISDCVNGRIFQVTNLQATGQPNETLVAHPVSQGLDPGNRDPLLGDQEFTVGAQVMAFGTRTYFVAPSSFNNQINSLWLKQGVQPSVELVEGIEDMRLTYGVDTNGDGVPDDYRREDQFTTPNAWQAVAAVRINLLLQSLEANVLPEPQPLDFDGVAVDVSDRRLRQVFTATVGIRNRLP